MHGDFSSKVELQVVKNSEKYIAPAPRLILRLLCLRRMIDDHFIELPVESRFVEIGSGLGDTAALFIQLCIPADIRLFELSSVAREILAKRFENHSTVKVYSEFKGSIEPCNLLATMEVLEHIEDDLGFLSAINHSMMSNGFLIGSVPAFASKWQDSDVLVGHYRRYEKHDLVEKLKISGFEVIDIRSYGFPLLNAINPIRKMYYWYALTKAGKSRIDRTAESGVSRAVVKRLNSNLIVFLCKVSNLLRCLSVDYKKDDGFVFLCRKAE